MQYSEYDITNEIGKLSYIKRRELYHVAAVGLKCIILRSDSFLVLYLRQMLVLIFCFVSDLELSLGKSQEQCKQNIEFSEKSWEKVINLMCNQIKYENV